MKTIGKFLALSTLVVAISAGCTTPPPDVIVVNQLPEPKPAQVSKPTTTVVRKPAPQKSDPTTIEPVKPPQTYSNY